MGAPRFAVVSGRQAALLLELLSARGVDLKALSMHLGSFVRDPRKVANGRDLEALRGQLEAAAAAYAGELQARAVVEPDLVPALSGRMVSTAEARELLHRCGVVVEERRVRGLAESGAFEGARRAAGRWSIPERSLLEYAEGRKRQRGMPRGVRSGMVGA